VKQVNENFAPFDIADYLHTEEDMLGYLNAIMEEGGTQELVAKALQDVARARLRNSAKQQTSENKTHTYDLTCKDIVDAARKLGYKLSFAPC